MNTAATKMIHSIGFNVNGCSSITSFVSARPSTTGTSLDDFRTAAMLIEQIITMTIIKGTVHISKANTSYLLEGWPIIKKLFIRMVICSAIDLRQV